MELVSLSKINRMPIANSCFNGVIVYDMKQKGKNKQAWYFYSDGNEIIRKQLLLEPCYYAYSDTYNVVLEINSYAVDFGMITYLLWKADGGTHEIYGVPKVTEFIGKNLNMDNIERMNGMGLVKRDLIDVWEIFGKLGGLESNTINIERTFAPYVAPGTKKPIRTSVDKIDRNSQISR